MTRRPPSSCRLPPRRSLRAAGLLGLLAGALGPILRAGEPTPADALQRARALAEEARRAGSRRDFRGMRHRLEEACTVIEEELDRVLPSRGKPFDELVSAYSGLTHALVELHQRRPNAGARGKVVERTVETFGSLLQRSFRQDTDAFEGLAETYVDGMIGMMQERYGRGDRGRTRQLADRLLSRFEELMAEEGAPSHRSLRPLVQSYAAVSRRIARLYGRQAEIHQMVAHWARVEEHLGALLGEDHRAVGLVARERRRLAGRSRTPGPGRGPRTPGRGR